MHSREKRRGNLLITGVVAAAIALSNAMPVFAAEQSVALSVEEAKRVEALNKQLRDLVPPSPINPSIVGALNLILPGAGGYYRTGEIGGVTGDLTAAVICDSIGALLGYVFFASKFNGKPTSSQEIASHPNMPIHLLTGAAISHALFVALSIGNADRFNELRATDFKVEQNRMREEIASIGSQAENRIAIEREQQQYEKMRHEQEDQRTQELREQIERQRQSAALAKAQAAAKIKRLSERNTPGDLLGPVMRRLYSVGSLGALSSMRDAYLLDFRLSQGRNFKKLLKIDFDYLFSGQAVTGDLFLIQGYVEKDTWVETLGVGGASRGYQKYDAILTKDSAKIGEKRSTCVISHEGFIVSFKSTGNRFSFDVGDNFVIAAEFEFYDGNTPHLNSKVIIDDSLVP